LKFKKKTTWGEKIDNHVTKKRRDWEGKKRAVNERVFSWRNKWPGTPPKEIADRGRGKGEMGAKGGSWGVTGKQYWGGGGKKTGCNRVL